MPRYALYARKSDEDTRVTEKSIGEQVAALTSLAAERNLAVVARYEESRSARTPGDRPLFREMLRQVETGDVNGVLCWHVNRLARNMEEGGKLAQLLIDGRIREIVTPHATYRSGDNILPLVLEAATSAQFIVELSRNVRRGLAGHFEAGGVNHKARLGYRNGRDPDNPRKGVVLADEPRFSLLGKGFQMLATGAYTVAQVAAELTDTWGFRTRVGTKVTSSTWYAVFRDPFYAGWVRYKGELRKGTHTPVVSEATFQSAQEVLDSRVRARQKRQLRSRMTDIIPAYTGLMRCGLCGQQITAERHRLANGNPYVFYRCSDSRGMCGKKGVGEATLEAALLSEVERVTLEPELCQIAADNIRDELQARRNEVDRMKEQGKMALAGVERQLRRLEEMWLSGLMDDEARFRERKQTLAKEREKLVIATARTTINDGERTLESVSRFAVTARETFLGGSPARRREVVHALGRSYRLYGRERRLEVEPHPVLCQFVQYANTIQAAQRPPTRQPVPGVGGTTVRSVQTWDSCVRSSFELVKVGSRSTKKAPAREALFVGRSGATGIEPPGTLIDLLLSGSFAGLRS